MIVLPSISSGVISSSLSKIFDPKKISGLALWLKADTGVSTPSFNYISEIEIAGTSSPNLNGTYTAIPPTSESSSYGFTGPSNGFSMGWNQSEERFELFSDEYLERGFISVDGINWNIYNSFLYQFDINGGSGGGSVGTYTWNDNEEAYYHSSGAFNIQGTDLRDEDTNELISQNFQPDYQGEWSNNAGDTENRVFIPAGSISGSVTTSTANTDHVTAWVDQSGNGRNASSYNDPQLITNQINGKPVIDFDATQYFTSENQNLNNNSSIFFVVKSRGDHGIIFSTSDYEGLVFALTSNPNNSFAVGISNLFEIANDGADNGNNWMIGSTIRSNNLTSIIYKNGIQVANGDYNTSSLNPTAPLIIGTDADLNSYWNLDGQIAEILIYNRALTISERQQVEAYLNSKYAIY